MTNYIWITTQFEGFHSYQQAPQDVEFLKNKHRHIFKVKIWIEIEHNDRDIEFIQFKRFVDKVIKKNMIIINYKSCEMIADVLFDKINRKYPNRKIKIEVSEDGENGCEKEY